MSIKHASADKNFWYGAKLLIDDDIFTDTPVPYGWFGLRDSIVGRYTSRLKSVGPGPLTTASCLNHGLNVRQPGVCLKCTGEPLCIFFLRRTQGP